MLFLLCLFLIPSVILLIALLVNFKMNMNREKSSPFECGFDPLATSRIPFSLRFFILAVLFLVFDIEIVLILPLPLLLSFTPPSSFLCPATVFLLILILGLLHEWNEGSLDWSS